MRRFPIMSTVGFLLWNSIPGPNWEHVCAFMLALTAVIVNYFLISYFHYFLPVKGSEVHALMQSFNIGFLFLVHVTVECLLILVIICLSNMLAPVSPITKNIFQDLLRTLKASLSDDEAIQYAHYVSHMIIFLQVFVWSDFSAWELWVIQHGIFNWASFTIHRF